MFKTVDSEIILIMTAVENIIITCISAWSSRRVSMYFFSRNEGILINNHAQHQNKKAPKRKIDGFFFCKRFWNCILNEKFNLKRTTIRAFFPKTKALFSYFWKRAGETPPSPPLVTRLSCDRQSLRFRFNDTHVEKLLLLNSAQKWKFMEIEAWLLLTFFKFLQNQLSSIHSIDT